MAQNNSRIISDLYDRWYNKYGALDFEKKEYEKRIALCSLFDYVGIYYNALGRSADWLVSKLDPMKKGFTMAEFLVTIMIIGILASVSFWGYGERRQELKLQKEANFLVSKSEEIKERAISGKNYCGIFPSGGYGVYFDSEDRTRYVLFADCNNNGAYDSSGMFCNGSCQETLEIITLDPVTALVVSSPVNIVFVPPSPTVLINGNPQTILSARLEIARTTKWKTIYFNSSGLIYVQ